MGTSIDEVAQLMKNCTVRISIKTYRLDQIFDAHRDMEETLVGAKMVTNTYICHGHAESKSNAVCLKRHLS